MKTSTETPRSLGPQAPQKIQKPSTHYNAKSTACQACYARKKRCIAAPTQSRCTYCSREDQDCVPRERQARPQKRGSAGSAGSGLNFPYPHGIDHEVPRWAAVYSAFSEVLRLIPPEGEYGDGGYDSNDDSMEREEGRGDLKDTMSGRENGDSEIHASVPNPTHERITDDVKPHSQHLGSGFSLGELDALLRF